MFGPNTYFKHEVNICYSHRDKFFFDLFKETRNLFSEKFCLQDYDILFVPGSGTIGIESLFFSCKRHIKMIGLDGTFRNRWAEMESGYTTKNNKTPFEMFCRLETSRSGVYTKDNCFIDAISSFPYYDIPQNTLGFVTCLNKQLGSYVGLAVVCIRKDIWNDFIDEGRMSYLNLARYKSYHAIDQAPSTSATNIYEHFLTVLKEFDINKHIDRINQVSDMVVSAIGIENIVGERRCPVITLKPGIVPENLARKYNIYGYWSGRPNYQIFTYSDTIDQYEMFLNELKKYI